MALRLDFEVYLGPGGDPAELIALLDQAGTVSYTHLTLPTNREV